MILDEVYMIVGPTLVFSTAKMKPMSVLYAIPAHTQEEAWKNAIEAIKDITGWDKEFLYKAGYRARKVQIVFK
jgi:hypothetical protein